VDVDVDVDLIGWVGVGLGETCGCRCGILYASMLGVVYYSCEQGQDGTAVPF